MKLNEKRIRPRFAGPGRGRRGRRPLAGETLGEIDQIATEAAAEIAPRIERMIADRLDHVAANIPEQGKAQELVVVNRDRPPFFGVTTREIDE